MAGEYSRELSCKVFAGQCRLIEMGFRQGGAAGYGLRRQLIDRNGISKSQLNRGDRKSFQTDRVILVPGPDQEIAVVREIYERFVRNGETEVQIASSLNHRGIVSDLMRPWTRATIHQILTNPKYVGTNVYNRQSFKLKQKRINNPPNMWITRQGAFEPIVPAELFVQARAIIQARHRHLSDDELLNRLRSLLTHYGSLSGLLIDQAEEMPSSSVYASRFGGLYRAYQLIGWEARRDFSYVEINRAIRTRHADLIKSIIGQLQSIDAGIRLDSASGLLTINESFTASLVLARCHETPSHACHWQFRFDTSLLPDITIAARLSPGNQVILDYYLFPRVDVLWQRLRLRPDNGVVLDLYRFENLKFFECLARTVSVEEAA
jgi:hypothetical protein